MPDPMEYSLAYGRGKMTVRIPESNVVKVLGIQPGTPLPDPTGEVRAKIMQPTGTAPLARLAEGRRSACIVISDITRPVPNKVILPPVLETLEQAGMDPSEIVILVATGLHRASTPEEKLEMLGQAIVDRYPVLDHDALNREEHDYLGESSGGVPVWVDRRYLRAELKILTGLIEPHLMAGFSGGRKAICPGITGAETIGPWHSPRFLEHENAKPGCMDDNPVHREQMEIARLSGCDFIVNVVIDHRRNVLRVVAGDMEQAHLEGVRFAREILVDTVDEPVDIVVTSAAGYPLDKTWYQAIKGIVGAVDIVKPGGTIIIASACDEGAGSEEFDEIAQKYPTVEAFMDAICSGDYFIINQWQLEELGKALRKATVQIVSDGMSPELFRRYYVRHVPTVEQAVTEALERYGSQATIAVIPDGPYVLSMVGRRSETPDNFE